MTLTRRSLLLTFPCLLSACITKQSIDVTPTTKNYRKPVTAPIPEYYQALYGSVYDEQFPIAAVDLQTISPRFWRRTIAFPLRYRAGTIIIDLAHYFCYFVLPNGHAIRYGVGIAKTTRNDFKGSATIGRKAVWPSWTPTDNMIKTQPKRYGDLKEGMPPGSQNPLGARALYLYRDGRDTLFHLHGSPEAWSIGHRVSSGCIRFLNQDIIDLYQRVSVGDTVIIVHDGLSLKEEQSP